MGGQLSNGAEEGAVMSDEQGFDEVGRAYYNAPHMDLKGKSSGEDGHEDGEIRDPATKETANLISSLCQDGQHRPVMDFDIPARYVASTTPGHGHLYIDKPLSWDQYQKVLNVLAEVGILEAGYVGAAIRRGASFVRPEWVKKPGKSESAVITDGPDNDIVKLIEAAEAAVK
jgi:hypothetical protein